MKKKRPYQTEALEQIYKSFENGHQCIIVCQPTGTGKTIVLSSFCSDVVPQGKIPMVLVNRSELLDQSDEKMQGEGVHAALINPANRPEAGQAYIASIETLNRRTMPYVDFLICDEVHIEQHDKIIERYLAEHPHVKVIGFTATPMREKGTKRPLHRFFTHLIETIDTPTAIAEGYLVRAVTYGAQLDLDKVAKTKNGEFQEAALFAAYNKSSLYDGVISNYLKFAKGKKGICFNVNVEHSQTMARRFNQAGIPAAHVDGNTPKAERKRIREAYRTGEIMMVCNCGVYTTGFDEPTIGVVILNRATTSLPLFLQMCLDLETEVLTADGWKKHDQVTDTDIVASFNPDTKAIQFAPHLGKVFRPVHENEYFCEASGVMVDFRVTNQHDLLFKSKRSTAGNWLKAPAEELLARKSEYLVPVSGLGPSPGLQLTPAELAFIGWFMSDGSLNKKTNCITISQSVSQPAAYHESIKNAISGCGFKYGEHRVVRKDYTEGFPDMIYYTISKGKPRGRDKHLTGWERLAAYLDRQLPESLYNCTPDEWAAILYTMNLGNGNKHKAAGWTQRSYHISTGDKVFADRVQALCVLKGFRCNLATHYFNVNPVYILHIKRKDSIMLRGANGADGLKMQQSASAANEQVWCLSTVDGTLITRRNGKVLIMGNCGRGSRPICDVNFDTKEERLAAIEQSDKDKFIIIDHGSNWTRFGHWSDPREWNLSPERKRPAGIAPVRFCPSCEAIIMQSARWCEWCEYEIPYEKRLQELLSSEFVKLDQDLLPPELASKGVMDMSIPEMELYRKFKDYHVHWVVQQLRLQAKHLASVSEQKVDPATLFDELMKLYSKHKNYHYAWRERFAYNTKPETQAETVEHVKINLSLFDNLLN